jgi:hypothetical protein
MNPDHEPDMLRLRLIRQKLCEVTFLMTRAQMCPRRESVDTQSLVMGCIFSS